MKPSAKVRFIPKKAREAIEAAKKAQLERNKIEWSGIERILNSGLLSSTDRAKVFKRANLLKSAEREADREMIRQVGRARFFLRRKNPGLRPKKAK